MISYQNGNTKVTIDDDGTKVREYENTPLPLFPETIDIKLTDHCNLGCPQCYEMSTNEGQHGNLRLLLAALEDLPAGVELACGGGNLLAHPDLIWFLLMLKERGIIANITINQAHLKQYYTLIEGLIKSELVKGVGISINNGELESLYKLKGLSNNIVYHIIAGYHSINIIDKLIDLGTPCKILILGYKRVGRGADFYSGKIEENLQTWYRLLSKYIGKCLISFDNLAIEQLNVKRLFTDEGWDKFYMGDDFTFSMYIDAVKQEFAPTSRSSANERVSWEEYTLLNYFKNFRL